MTRTFINRPEITSSLPMKAGFTRARKVASTAAPLIWMEDLRYVDSIEEGLNHLKSLGFSKAFIEKTGTYWDTHSHQNLHEKG